MTSKNLIGKEFGLVVIIKYGGLDKWIGICRGCFKEKMFTEKALLDENIISCGKCKEINPKFKILKSKSNYYDNREGDEYKTFCKKVFARDNFKCVICGKSGWINAHHLDGWNWFIAGRFDTNNAVTLCAGKNSCHNKFHELYGKGNNTKEQFHEFSKFHKK